MLFPNRTMATSLLAALVSTGLWADGQANHERAAAEGPGQTAVIDLSNERVFPEGLVYDFGEHPRGNVVKHTFPIINAGKAALKIVSLRSKCGSPAEITAFKKMLLPNEKGEVTVSVDTARFRGLKKIHFLVVIESGSVRKDVSAFVSADSR